MVNLTQNCIDLFLEYANDARNWNGTPLVGGNVTKAKKEAGMLIHLKTEGLIKTFTEEGCVWMEFTPKGYEFALQHGVEI